MDGTPVALRLQSVTGGASDFVGEEFSFSINPEGCSEECGDESRRQPKYMEIMVSVDGKDAVTIYNGDYTASVTLSVPNGEVVLLVLIYNCDCCEAFSGYSEMTLPDDGGEVLVEMIQDGPHYDFSFSRDGDLDTFGDMEYVESFCREPAEEEGWVPACLYESYRCDCDDSDPEINPDAAEVCDDYIDNDCDYNLDCSDPDCENDPACN